MAVETYEVPEGLNADLIGQLVTVRVVATNQVTGNFVIDKTFVGVLSAFYKSEGTTVVMMDGGAKERFTPDRWESLQVLRHVRVL